VAGVLAYAATRPDSLHVERSVSIQAPADRIFGFIADFHRWREWSPYEKIDPAMKRTHGGDESGTGAVYEWEGNKEVGAGRMEIIDTSAASRVTIKLDFSKPLEGHDIAQFTVTPQADSTTVTWKMDGPTPYVGKVIGLFIDMDAMIG